MTTFARGLGVSGLVLAALWVTQETAQAQFFPNPNANPFYAQQQYFQNVVAQRAAFGPGGASNVYNPVLGPGANLYTPGAPIAPAVNPFPAGAGYFDPYANPYYPYVDPYGGFLRGQADYLRAFGETTQNIETARIIREQALQSRYDTMKKRFDTEMYIKANTPTYTEEQAKIAKMTLKRIQTNSTATEVVNGKALNLLLDDLRRYPGKKAAMETLTLSEEVLKQINVTKGQGNYGLLRDNGKFTWPIAMLDLLTPVQQKEIESLTETLVEAAGRNKIDINALKDLRTSLNVARDALSKKVNEIPTNQYLDAKRFLNDFEDARLALEKGEASTQTKFREFIIGGKTIQEVADFLVNNGFKIAPAVSGDEAAYRAVFSAMAALDMAMNTQYGTPDSKDYAPPP